MLHKPQSPLKKVLSVLGWRSVFVLAILSLWVYHCLPLNNLDYFSYVKAQGEKAIQAKSRPESEIKLLDERLAKAVAAINEEKTTATQQALADAQAARDAAIAPAEAEAFRKAATQAADDVAQKRKASPDSPVPMNSSAALLKGAREHQVLLRKFIPSPGDYKPSNQRISRRIEQAVAGKLKLGIDLKGGVEFTLTFDPQEVKAKKLDMQETRDSVLTILKKRIDSKGVAEAEIRPYSDNTILVRVPVKNEEEIAALRALLARQATLHFRAVSDQFQGTTYDNTLPTPPGYQWVRMKDDPDNELAPPSYMLLKIKPEMSGKDIVGASAGQDPISGQWLVFKRFNDQGKEDFGNITERFVGKPLAIVLDGICYSAPNINERIGGGSAQISGMSNREEAEELAIVLQSGAMPVKLSIDGESRTDATLGANSIKGSLQATLIGVALVTLFMLLYYRWAGLFATIGMAANLVILASSLMIFGATITLPGIAAIALTLGMAVDANILIHERMREEIAAGKNVRDAIQIGFSRAMSAILDGNITTLLTGMVLYYAGSGPIQGFAIALCFGITTTLFTALVIPRIFFDLYALKYGERTSMPGMHLRPVMTFDYWSFRKKAYTFSIIGTIAIIVMVCVKGKDCLSVDFVGGTSITYRVTGTGEKPSTEDIAKTLAAAGVPDARCSYKTDVTTGLSTLELVSRETVTDTEKGPFIAKIDKAVNESGKGAVTFESGTVNSVGGLVSSTFAGKAALALALGFLVTFIYIMIRFETVFATGALVAMIHDAVFAIGFYLALGHQINLPTIAAILTVIGYSLNDTVVIFDRIRERSRDMKNQALPVIINRALNETFNRSILTALTVFMVALILCFGGGVEDFAIVMTAGVIIGTYSSIFVASPIVCGSKLSRQLEESEAAAAERKSRNENDLTVIK